MKFDAQFRQQTLRRSRTYSRRLAGVVSGRRNARVVFMHVPKCGGTSISEALYSTVPVHRRIGVIDADATRRAAAMIHADQDRIDLYHDDLVTGGEVFSIREAMLLTHMAWDTDLIHGHMLFSERAHRHFGDRYDFVTVLRDPIERVVSNFAHSRHDGHISPDFDTYLDSAAGRMHALTYLRYFSGRHDIAPDQEEDALETAKATLGKFALIGFLDQLDGFADGYRTLTGSYPRVFRYNEHAWQKYRPSPEQIERLRAMMKTEIAFWELAQAYRR